MQRFSKLFSIYQSMLIFSFLILNTNCTYAKENDINFKSFMKFTAGIVSAYSIHEASHLAVAEITNTELDWGVGTYNQPLGFTEYSRNNDIGFAISSIGLTSQIIGSEIILKSDKIDKNDAFTRGMMTWNIINPILYSLDYWFIHIANRQRGDSYQGDIQGIEHYSDKSTANAFALAFAGIAAFQGYRYLNTQDFYSDQKNDKSYNVNLGPRRSGGLELKLEFKF